MIRIQKEDYEYIYFSVALLPVLWPTGLTKAYLPMVGDAITSIGVVISVLLTMIVSRFSKKIIINRFNILLTLFFTVFIISTFTNGRNMFVDYIKTYLTICALLNCFQYALYTKRLLKFLNTYIFIVTLFIFCDLVLQLIHPEGIAVSYYYNILGDYQRINTVYFWGHKNYYGYYLIPFVACLFIRNDLFRNGKFGIFDIIRVWVCFALILLTGGTTSLLSLLVMVLLQILYRFRSSANKVIRVAYRVKFIVYVYIGLFLFIVVFQVHSASAVWISTFFNKSLVLTGRGSIWKSALEFISKRVLLGYGTDNIIPHVGYYWYAHNLILDILIQGGVLALVVFIVMVVICFRPIEMYNNVDNTRIDIVCLVASMSVTLLVESCVKSNPFMYLTLYLALIYPRLLNYEIRNTNTPQRGYISLENEG